MATKRRRETHKVLVEATAGINTGSRLTFLGGIIIIDGEIKATGGDVFRVLRGKMVENGTSCSVVNSSGLSKSSRLLRQPLVYRFDLCLGKAGRLRYFFPRKPKLQEIFCCFKLCLAGTAGFAFIEGIHQYCR